MKGRKVCNKTRSPSASLLLKGQGTEHITVKWPIGRHEVLSPINHNYERKKEKKFGGKENTTNLVVRYEKKTSLSGTFP